MCNLLFGLLLEICSICNKKCIFDDGHQWIGFLYISTPGLLSCDANGGRVFYHSWSGTHYDVLRQTFSFSCSHLLRISPSYQSLRIRINSLLAFNTSHRTPSSNCRYASLLATWLAHFSWMSLQLPPTHSYCATHCRWTSWEEFPTLALLSSNRF